MRRFILVIAFITLVMIPYDSRENPITVSILSELILPNPLGWTLEIDSWYVDTLDTYVLATKSDTVGFKPGIIIGNGIVTVTPNDLERPVPLGMLFDFVVLRGVGLGQYSRLSYGADASDDVRTPQQGQSICSYSGSETYYLDNSPTIGQPNDTANAQGLLVGTVTTSGGAPIGGVQIYYHWDQSPVLTDLLGRFEIHDLAMKEDLGLYHPDYKSSSTTVQIWPESTVTVTLTLDPIVGVERKMDLIVPPLFSLSQNYPNPFNPSTMIEFSVPMETFVAVDIYTVGGKLVTNLVSEVVEAGRHNVQWNAGNLPSGLYICSMKAGGFTSTRKLLILR